MIQEKHLKEERSPYLQSHHFPYVYRAAAKNSKTGGVAILIARVVDWQLIETRIDNEGRWIIVRGKCYGKEITMVSIYAPNTGQVCFLEKVLEEVMEVARATNKRP